MPEARICFVTEADHYSETGGAKITDTKTQRSLSKFGRVDTVCLGKSRWGSRFAALSLFVFSILRSLSQPYSIYFSRGLIGSFVLISLKPFHRKEVIHQALSVPFPSSETRYVNSKIESMIQYCLYRFLERKVLLNADAITVAAETYSDELVRFGVKKSKVHTVPFYVEDEFFKQSVKQDAGEIFCVCYAGHFQSYHDLLPLVQAFDLLRRSEQSIMLLLVGDGVLRKKTEQEVNQRNLQGIVSFVGKLPHSSMPLFLSTVDAFVFLTRKSGISTSLLEAAATGKAIITLRRTNDPALDRYFRHNREVYLVNDISPSGIAKAIELLCSNNQFRNALAIGAKKAAQRNFSERVAASRLRELMKRLHPQGPNATTARHLNWKQK
jgi:glycosyltransferase involved in cell wall biosynthesis